MKKKHASNPPPHHYLVQEVSRHSLNKPRVLTINAILANSKEGKHTYFAVHLRRLHKQKSGESPGIKFVRCPLRSENSIFKYTYPCIFCKKRNGDRFSKSTYNFDYIIRISNDLRVNE